MEKYQNPNFLLPRSRIRASSTLESSMKGFLRRFDSNQNKSKQMKINDVFNRFTSKAYSAAILNKNFPFISTLSAKTADSKIIYFQSNRIFSSRLFWQLKMI